MECEIYLTISSDQTWKASDGSSAETSVVKSYTAPDDDGPPWELYKVKHSSGSGILYNVEYIQRVMTQGGLPPLTAPQAGSDTARAAFLAEYILYKQQKP